MMRIATYNINGINKRLTNLLDWLADRQPDVVCLQELKATDAHFPIAEIKAARYDAIWLGESRWNGVAILSQDQTPILTCRKLPGDENDEQARYIEAAVGGVIVASIYAPNGNPQPGPKFDFKLAWLARLRARAQELVRADAPIVLAGDFNVAPAPNDIYETKSYDANALVLPESRVAFQSLLDLGLTDALRHLHPQEAIYTFWDYRRQRWERNAGLRLDHLLLNANAMALLSAAGVDRPVRGMENASDHAPIWVDLDGPAR